MSELEKLLKDILLGGVGAVATAVEKADELAKLLVEKGQQTVRQGQDATEEFKRKWQESMRECQMDVSQLTKEQREELRRRLDELDKAEQAAAADEEADCSACPMDDDENCEAKGSCTPQDEGNEDIPDVQGSTAAASSSETEKEYSFNVDSTMESEESFDKPDEKDGE